MFVRIVALSLSLLILGSISNPVSAQGFGKGFTVTYKSPPAPKLRLRSLDGQEIDLSTMNGRVVIVNFWATWCPPCIEEMPTIQALWERTNDKGLDVLAVNVGERVADIETFLNDFEPKLRFPILLDPDGEAFQAWNVRGLPKTFVVDKQGRLVYEAEGGRDMNSEHIRGVLQGLIDR